MLRLSDYHTIGGGYDRKTDAMKKPRAASGATLETVLSERHYLLDARFGVLLEGERAFLDDIAAKLRDPKWGVWLGRKCCMPASPLLVGVADDRAAAFRTLLARTGYAEDRALESVRPRHRRRRRRGSRCRVAARHARRLRRPHRRTPRPAPHPPRPPQIAPCPSFERPPLETLAAGQGSLDAALPRARAARGG